ncbi:MAG TPA: S-adenosylmethionine:tRNA ribosyltransferase-isomerase [Microlunatus sp.]|nr:S-adenosylmethionine:tRNA ribosyltransferase-isomerase [Microlunatus sp.]
MTALDVHPTTRVITDLDLTAHEPPESRGLPRDGVRLLVAGPDGVRHSRFAELDRFLHPGDLLVINTSATLPGQLDGHRGAEPVIVHVANRLPDGSRVVELRTAPKASDPVLDAGIGEVVDLPSGATLRLVEPYPREGSSPTGQGNRLWRGRLSVDEPVDSFLARHGRPISYGYLRRRFPIECYQTIFALHPGSAEMPSAGRPFTPELVTRLVSRGIGFAPVTLHTSVSSQEAGEGPLAEWYAVGTETARLINEARAAGRRVIAVGTTATRAVESAATESGEIRPDSGWTDIVISSLRSIRSVGGLITGWHDPEASHLLLVEAVAGGKLTQQAYDEAVRERYRWHEFGDVGLFLPQRFS